MVTIYGIPNCDTMRKARKWLDDHGVEYRFHDFKRQGLSEGLLSTWVNDLGWETLLNRRGMIWRKLPEKLRSEIDGESAIRIMLETPSIIRRPLLDTGAIRHVGFSEAQYEEIFR